MDPTVEEAENECEKAEWTGENERQLLLRNVNTFFANILFVRVVQHK